VEWMHLSQDINQFLAVVNSIIEFQVPFEARKFIKD
jgi:hypothetical protein